MILLMLLAFILGAGAAVLTLWLSGELWSSRSSSSYSSGSYGSGGYGSNSTMATTDSYSSSSSSPYSNSATGSSGTYQPNTSSIVGSWAPSCSGSPNQRVTFYSDGSAYMDGETGRWSVSGNYVTMTSSRGQTMTLYWEMLSASSAPSSAQVRRAGDSQSRYVYRCS